MRNFAKLVLLFGPNTDALFFVASAVEIQFCFCFIADTACWKFLLLASGADLLFFDEVARWGMNISISLPLNHLPHRINRLPPLIILENTLRRYTCQWQINALFLRKMTGEVRLPLVAILGLVEFYVGEGGAFGHVSVPVIILLDHLEVSSDLGWGNDKISAEVWAWLEFAPMRWLGLRFVVSSGGGGLRGLPGFLSGDATLHYVWRGETDFHHGRWICHILNFLVLFSPLHSPKIQVVIFSAIVPQHFQRLVWMNFSHIYIMIFVKFPWEIK